MAEDRYVLAVVLVGSLSAETIWQREAIGLWIIEADGVSRRLPSDGEDERVFRILVENGINIHAEVIPRSRFKKMVEGASRTAFSCNFFARRQVVYSKDPSIESWFKRPTAVAAKDQERELLTFSTWTIHAHRHARKRTGHQGRPRTGGAGDRWGPPTAWPTPRSSGGAEVCEQDVIYRAMEGDPALFQTIYLDVLAKRENRARPRGRARRDRRVSRRALPGPPEAAAGLPQEAEPRRPLSEISDQFAFSQVHPWHLESACEWLERKGLLQKVSAPFKLTKRSLERVEEPAYFLDG